MRQKPHRNPGFCLQVGEDFVSVITLPQYILTRIMTKDKSFMLVTVCYFSSGRLAAPA